MLYAGIYPIDNEEYDKLKDAMEKISLSDSSLEYEYESSQALGFGIRCGFLGLLHMDVIKERISREFNIECIVTAPSVKYIIDKTDNTLVDVDNPSKLPERTMIRSISEPFVKLIISTPEDYIGECMNICQIHRGIYKDLQHVIDKRYKLIYSIPLSEIITNFFDKLKSASRGYASMDYEIEEYKIQPLLKVDILLNGEKVDALSFIAHKDFINEKARVMCEKLKEFIPKQQFEVPIQAVIGGKIIARETIKAMFKNVLAKCYGGDVTRKKKLLEAQKEGKKRLKEVGSVSLPDDIFLKILKS
jgi:GTP-binding protein LepA